MNDFLLSQFLLRMGCETAVVASVVERQLVGRVLRLVSAPDVDLQIHRLLQTLPAKAAHVFPAGTIVDGANVAILEKVGRTRNDEQTF